MHFQLKVQGQSKAPVLTFYPQSDDLVKATAKAVLLRHAAVGMMFSTAPTL